MADGSLKIGSIAGIDIELHWLFILLILFFIYLSPLLGLVWILLFVCVLIHELSHSITALRNRVKVTKIILLPIGGVSIIDELHIDPRVEFNMAIAGPLMSLFLGGLFGIMVLFTPPGILTYIVQYLFLINILLGLFNILPAFPMDGGRVLRSFLERRQGMYDATMTTAKVSKYFMALIIIATLAFVAIPSAYSVGYKEIILLWDFIIVFFLYGGVQAEVASVTMREETKGMKLKDALSHDYALVSYNSKPEALYGMIKKKKEHLILTRLPDGSYALVNIFNNKALEAAKSVKDLSAQIPNLQYGTDMVDALSKIEGNSFRVAVVLKGRKLLGIATGSHLSALLTLHMAENRRKGFK